MKTKDLQISSTSSLGNNSDSEHKKNKKVKKKIGFALEDIKNEMLSNKNSDMNDDNKSKKSLKS